MKTRTLTTIIAFFLTATTTALFAQMPSMPQTPTVNAPSAQQMQQTASASSGSFTQKAEKEAGKISAAVGNLSDDQKTKLKQAFVDYYTQREKNKATAGGDADQLKKLNAATNKSKKDAIKSILTPDQFAAWKNAAKQKMSGATTAPAGN